MPTLVPVERIRAPSAAEFLSRYVKPSRPVILEGAIDHWPAMKQWTVEKLKQRFGERRLPAIRSKDGQWYDDKAGLTYESVRFADYVDLLSEATPSELYMLFRTHEHLPELFDDIVRPVYCARARWFRSRFWFAAPATKGALHRDLPDNLYAQVVGQKRFILLDRRLTRMVHTHPLYSGVPNYSPVDAMAPDLERHPRFRGAPLLDCTLGPGDLLFIPSLWWHQAASVGTSISVNLWWVDGGLLLPIVKGAELFMKVRGLKL
jgi:hypothetical protein